MTRRWLVLALLALGACGSKPEMAPNLFPETAAGGWRLAEAHNLSAADAPDPVPRSSVEQVRAAVYKAGDAEIQSRVYLLSSPEVGAALEGRWRPSADTVFFSRGSYFVVVKWQAADRKAVQEFVAALQRRLGTGGSLAR
jgi:hypothetical protein